MKTRFLAAAIAVLALATSASARVLSYAPYTNTPAAPGLHARTSRFFVLVEGSNEWVRQAVLYDTSEREEPRVIYPPAGSSFKYDAIHFVALHERTGDGQPLFLIGTQSGTFFSGDGGATWTAVNGISSLYLALDEWVDYGGAYTQPMWHPVQTGNDRYPFFVRQQNGGFFAIDAHGTAKRLASASSLIGSDRERNRFLVRVGNAVELIDVWGNRKKLFDVQPGSRYEGWITANGQAYLLQYNPAGRFLWHYRNRNLYFVAGPYDTPPPIGDVARYEGDELRFFAVPTADYEGAWMIQRQHSRPTTLSRHMAGGDLEVMWSDPAGPEVEALIPGQSGETLLVQVHVPRPTTTDTFVDPALAVWRVGTPMPAEYDELYVHEEANKGFLHVDVDRMHDGEPFVFNSGILFDDRPAEGPISAPIGGGADIYQEWGVVRASLKQQLVLPGVTRTAGAHGSQWSTDITIYNPLGVPQRVEVRYAGGGVDPASVAATRLTRTITLAPRELYVLPDVLNSLFLVAASGGSLFFEPEVGVNVFGRTYTRRGDGGTYGYGLHAIERFNAAGPRFPLTYAGAFPGPNFRTNVLITDTSGRGTEADLIGVATASTFAGGVAQWSGAPRPSNTLRIQPMRGTLIPMVVAIDNGTNDATYFPPDPAAPDERVIPVVASDGTWKTDIFMHNASLYDRGIRFIAFPHDGSAPVTARWYLERGSSHVYRDALQTLFGLKGRASVFYVSDDEVRGEGIRVTSRLYAKDAHSGGTYGTAMPPLNQFQQASIGDTLQILGIAGGNALQTNLTLVGLDSSSSIAEIRIFGDDGAALATFRETLPARQAKVFEDVFARQGIAVPRAARIEVTNVAGARFAAFGTLVDRITGDPTYLPANLSAKGN